jgi:hypothetical protein
LVAFKVLRTLSQLLTDSPYLALRLSFVMGSHRDLQRP